MRVTLTVTEGPHQGKVFGFEQHDNFIVGRGNDAHFRLPIDDKYFSRVHFMVEVNPPQCRLVDMGSRNGTHVNGQRVNAADLKDGDVIRGGKTVMRLAVQYSDTDMVGMLETIPPAQLKSVLAKPAQPLKSTEAYVSAESPMAPEQITNYRDSKPPVDLYAAGASLYHLLTGRFVYDFEGCKKNHLLMILQDEPVPIQSRRKSIPAELAAAIHRSLLKEPAARFADAAAMRAALAPFRAVK